MDLDLILQNLDEEIDRLQRVRALLTGQTAPLKVRNVSEESRARMAAGSGQRSLYLDYGCIEHCASSY
jgi:hypothetical protein